MPAPGVLIMLGPSILVTSQTNPPSARSSSCSPPASARPSAVIRWAWIPLLSTYCSDTDPSAATKGLGSIVPPAAGAQMSGADARVDVGAVDHRRRGHAGALLASPRRRILGSGRVVHDVARRGVAFVLALHLPHAIDDDGAVDAGVLGDAAQRIIEHVADDLGAELLVALRARACRATFSQRIRATPPPGTMPSSRAACVACHGVFEQGLAFLHFGFGGGADVDLGHAAGQLGQPLLQLLAIVLAVGARRSRGGSARPGRRSPSSCRRRRRSWCSRRRS